MNDHDVIIVGAGIAGLSAAVTAASAGVSTLVLDTHQSGGRARTEVDGHGYAFNVGPHALYLNGVLHRLLLANGIDPAGRTPDTAHTRLLRNGKLTPFDFSARGIAATSMLGVRDRGRLLKLLGSLARLRAERFVGTSVAQWLGDLSAPVRQFAEQLVRITTYANDPERLDAGATITQIQMALTSGVRYLDGGWQTIVDGLVGRAVEHGAALRSGEVRSIRTDGGRVSIAVGEATLTASTVIVAAGGPSVATRLTGSEADLAAALTPPIAASVLDLGLVDAVPGTAFGLDEPLYLSAHAPLASLAPAGRGLVSVARYLHPDRPAAPPKEAKAALRAFAALAGIGDEMVVSERYLHRLTVVHGAPAAHAGGLHGRPGIDALGVDGVLLAGDWIGPEGMLADAAAASGIAAARQALSRCASIAA